MNFTTFCVIFIYALGYTIGYILENEICQTWRVDPRDEPQEMDTSAGNFMNVFISALVPNTGRIKHIKYYAHKAGKAYVSFWTRNSNVVTLHTKIEINSERNGLQTHELTDEKRVETGQILGVHYPNTANTGVVMYQAGGDTGHTLYNTRLKEIRDDGWSPGTQINLGSSSTNRGVALHIAICECKDGWHGLNCNNSCPATCLNSTACNKHTGNCLRGCSEGYNYSASMLCNQSCLHNAYGLECLQLCSGNCMGNEPCNVVDGTCGSGCKAGFDFSASQRCEQECDNIHFGFGCENECHCLNNVACDIVSGECPDNSCKPGWEGQTCSLRIVSEFQANSNETPEETSLALVVGLLIVILIAFASLIIIIILIRKRYRRAKPELQYLEENPTIRTTYENKVVKDVDTTKVDNEYEDNTTEVENDDVTAEDEQETDEEENPYYNQAARHVSTSRWITVAKFHTTLMHTSQDTLPKEYLSIPKGQLKPWTFAANPELVQKNKFKNILPYDYNRVVLEKDNDKPLSEYINATKILGYDNSATIEFIASQGPQKFTVDDFWHMLWQCDVRVVVMVTNLIENMKIKCEQYWPDDGYVNYAGIQISLVKEENGTDIITRHLKATKGSESRTLHQIHYVGWPDHGVPGSTSVIFSVLRSMRRLHKHPHPVVVHCSAGVGRTGTLIAIDQLVEEAGRTQRVDILACVRRLREQRVNMVQTLPQYKFIYRALDEHFSLNEEQVIPVSKAKEELQALLNSDAGKAKLKKQFKFLDDTKQKPTTDEMQTALSEVNKTKNSDLEVIPTDADRMMLETEDGEGNSYINAVEIKVPGEKSGYCVTQVPLDDTVTDFWRLLIENNIQNVIYFKDNQSDINKWLPREGSALTLGVLTVQCTGVQQVSESVEVIQTSVLRLSDQQTDIYVNVTPAQDQCEYANVAEQNQSDGEEVLRVRIHVTQCLDMSGDAHVQVNRIQKVQAALDSHRVPAQPIAVVCRNGAHVSGLFVACDVIKMQLLKHPTNIDIFNIVQIIREKRPQLISNMVQYRFLHLYAMHRLTHKHKASG